MEKGHPAFSKQPLDRAHYVGRGQTYVKHLFLQTYLYALTFKVLQAVGSDEQFLYIDGFSGPWKSHTGDHTDTSFSIALTVLSDVANQLRRKGSSPRIRAIFVEKDKNAAAELRLAVAEFPLIETTVINGCFEDCIEDIVPRVGNAFVFTFVDPTGWTGLALNKLAPLLKLQRSEVLVNLMAYSLTRHLDLTSVQGGIEGFFGGVGWRECYAEFWRLTRNREEAIRRTYLSQLKAICKFRYVTTTRVRFIDKNRTYFYLAYGTRHPAGIFVFRETERKAVELQEDLAYGSVIEKASAGGRINDMFVGFESPSLGVFRVSESKARQVAKAEFDYWTKYGSSRNEIDAIAHFMQHPHVGKQLVRSWIASAEKNGQLSRKTFGRNEIRLYPQQALAGRG